MIKFLSLKNIQGGRFFGIVWKTNKTCNILVKFKKCAVFVKVLTTVPLPSLKKEDGFKQKKSKTSAVLHTVLAGAHLNKAHAN